MSSHIINICRDLLCVQPSGGNSNEQEQTMLQGMRISLRNQKQMCHDPIYTGSDGAGWGGGGEGEAGSALGG